MNFKHVIADVEVFPNFHSTTFKCIESGKYKDFVICEWRNDLEEYIHFINNIQLLVGYNNIGYDDHIIHFIFNNHMDWVMRELNGDELSKLIYIHSSIVINSEKLRIPRNRYKYQPVDLFLVYHFDNFAKSTSLKQIEVRTKHPNVQDLPYSPSHIVKEHQIEGILKYNLNDVDVTDELYKRSKQMLQLRKRLGKEYNLDMLSYNDVKVGETIAKQMYMKYSGKKVQEFGKLRTYRDVIKIANCIPKNVEFQTQYMKNILEKFKNVEISGTKGHFKEKVFLGGNIFKLGQGGLHSDDKAGLIKCEKGMVLVEKDVASMYPSIILNEKIYPAHLGIEFLHGYNDIYEQRLAAKAAEKHAKNEGLIDEEASTINAGFKLALNGTYGKLGSEYSWLYDPLALMRVTVAGQLYLLMLIEAFVEAGIQVISANTDGVVIKYSKEKQQTTVDWIHAWWEDKTKLVLEDTYYDKIVFNNVNNYIAFLTGGYIKQKGEYEVIDKLTIDKLKSGDFTLQKALHKDNSALVIPYALLRYFAFGDNPANTIVEHDDIYDFCLSTKMRKGQIAKYIDKDGTKILGKVNRYYVSTDGGKLIKEYDDDRQQELVANQRITMFNTYEKKDMKDYHIDYNYYIKECNKRIRAIEQTQTTLL